MSHTGHEPVAGRRYDAALHLLDRQIVDPDGRPVAKVDDIVLEVRDDRLVVTALMCGPGALGPRLGGRLGAWVVSGWRRMRPDVDPDPRRLPFADVEWVDSAVHVGHREPYLHLNAVEDWLRVHIIGKLPGGRHEPS
jgi:sporulation protein YlmC with PRC-barrel domain